MRTSANAVAKRAEQRRNRDAARWYALDGTYHASVATRLSALHLPASTASGGALCRPSTTVLYDDDGGFADEEVESQGRTRCARCLKKRGAR